MNNRGFSCIELLVSTAFLAFAYSAIAREVKSTAEWQKSGQLATQAIAQAKRRAKLKGIK